MKLDERSDVKCSFGTVSGCMSQRGHRDSKESEGNY